MSLSLTDLEDELIDHLGLDEDDLTGNWPMSTIDLLINRSYWSVAYKFPFREKEISVTFPTVAGQGLYQCPTLFEALRLLSVEDPVTFVHTPINRITPFEYERRFINDPTGDAQDKPNVYTREGNNIRLGPIPDQVYSMTLKYWATLADLTSINNTLDIPQVWHEIILFGAVWRGLLKLGDVARAAAFKTYQRDELATIEPVEAKEEKDSRVAGLDVLWESPSEGPTPLAQRIDDFGERIR